MQCSDFLVLWTLSEYILSSKVSYTPSVNSDIEFIGPGGLRAPPILVDRGVALVQVTGTDHCIHWLFHWLFHFSFFLCALLFTHFGHTQEANIFGQPILTWLDGIFKKEKICFQCFCLPFPSAYLLIQPRYTKFEAKVGLRQNITQQVPAWLPVLQYLFMKYKAKLC